MIVGFSKRSPNLGGPDLLRELGRRELLTQESSGLLLQGTRGEQCVNHYTYATFQTDEENRVVTESRTLGNLSVQNMRLPDSKIILGGKRWTVIEVYHKEKTIVVRPDPGGRPPASKPTAPSSTTASASKCAS